MDKTCTIYTSKKNKKASSLVTRIQDNQPTTKETKRLQGNEWHTCARPAPDSIPSSKYPDGRRKSRIECDICSGGRRAVATTRRLGVATSTSEGTGVISSEMVQFMCDGAGVGGNVDGAGFGAIVWLMLTGMMKS